MRGDFGWICVFSCVRFFTHPERCGRHAVCPNRVDSAVSNSRRVDSSVSGQRLRGAITAKPVPLATEMPGSVPDYLTGEHPPHEPRTPQGSIASHRNKRAIGLRSEVDPLSSRSLSKIHRREASTSSKNGAGARAIWCGDRFAAERRSDRRTQQRCERSPISSVRPFPHST